MLAWGCALMRGRHLEESAWEQRWHGSPTAPPRPPTSLESDLIEAKEPYGHALKSLGSIAQPCESPPPRAHVSSTSGRSSSGARRPVPAGRDRRGRAQAALERPADARGARRRSWCGQHRHLVSRSCRPGMALFARGSDATRRVPAATARPARRAPSSTRPCGVARRPGRSRSARRCWVAATADRSWCAEVPPGVSEWHLGPAIGETGLEPATALSIRVGEEPIRCAHRFVVPRLVPDPPEATGRTAAGRDEKLPH